MGLLVTKEPIEIKALLKSVRENLGQEDDIDRDSLAVWSFNRLPKYLWEQWKGGIGKSEVLLGRSSFEYSNLEYQT